MFGGLTGGMAMSGSKPEVAASGAGAETDSEKIAADICVIGAGPAGLAVATAAAAFGRSVVLVERQRFGGDALNSGCIPLRALAAVGARAHGMRTAGQFGIGAREPEIDMRAVHRHVENVVNGVAPNFAPERFIGLGVRVIHAAARFVDRRTVLRRPADGAGGRAPHPRATLRHRHRLDTVNSGDSGPR